VAGHGIRCWIRTVKLPKQQTSGDTRINMKK